MASSQPRKRGGRNRTATSAATTQPIRVMIVDDHPIWRDTLGNLLEQDNAAEVVAEASDGSEVIERARASRPDVILMDINLPTMDGIETTKHVVAALPGVRILILASSDDRSHVISAVRGGAHGYLVKTAAPDEVVDAVTRIRRGEMVFPPALADFVLAELRRSDSRGTITPRVMLAVRSMLERKGLTELLQEAGIEIVHSASRLEDLAEAKAAAVDVAILDGDLLQHGSATERLTEILPDANVLVLTREPDADGAVRLLSRTGRGAGYVLKDRISEPAELMDAIARVARGGHVVDSDVVNRLVEMPQNVRSLNELTDREREVLAMMAQGHSNQAIADGMFLGLKTVEAHVRSIFMKLGLEPDGDVSRRVLAVIAYLRST